MTIKHLKIFVAVCQTGSTSAAGKKLLISQPSVSLAIKELEEHYGITLFDRIGKRLHITDAGNNFLQYALNLVNQFDNMEKEVKNLDATGVLRIGSSITIGNCLLPSYVNEFSSAHPDMDIKVFISSSNIVQSHILDNTLDIGLVEEGLAHNRYIVSSDFYDDELVFICSRSHGFAGRRNIRIKELQDQRFILREKGSAGRNNFDAVMSANGITVDPVWESVSTGAIVRAVSMGIGVSVLPYLLIKDNIDQNEISRFQVSHVSFKRKFSIIYHKNKFLTESARNFMSLCH